MTNKRWTRIVAWAIVVVMVASTLGVLVFSGF